LCHVLMALEEPAGLFLCTQPCSAMAAAESPGKASGMARGFHLHPASDKCGTTGSFPTGASGGNITINYKTDSSLIAMLHHEPCSRSPAAEGGNSAIL